MKSLKGIVPIIATPFHDDGSIDYESLRSELRYFKRVGCHGATLFGIAGEYYKLTDEECDKLIDVTIDECKALGLPTVISCTPHSTDAAVKRAKRIEAAGADCMMLLPPFFLKPSGSELFNHIKTVADSVKIPVMFQYAPEQTGVAIQPGVLNSLYESSPNMNYFKIECKPAGPYITSMIGAMTPQQRENCFVFAGNAGYQMLETFDRGAVGAMPGGSMASLYIKVYDAYMSGDRENAVKYHGKLLPILNHIRQNVEMIIHYEKEIMRRRGIIATSTCRHPGFAADPVMDEMFEMYYGEIKDILDELEGVN